MPAEIVKAYTDKFGPDDRSFAFKLDVHFKHSGSEPTGPPVSAAAAGAYQHPEAGHEGPNNVNEHPMLKRKMQETYSGRVRKYEITLAPYSNPTFSTAIPFIRLLVGPPSSIRLLTGRELDHFHTS